LLAFSLSRKEKVREAVGTLLQNSPRFPEEIPLGKVHADLAKLQVDGFGRDEFADGLDVEFPREIGDDAGDELGIGVLVDVLDHRSVDLDVIGRKPHDMLEIGIAGPEIVDGDLAAETLDVVDEVAHLVVILDAFALQDLEDHAVRDAGVFHEEPLDEKVGFAIHDVLHRKVDGELVLGLRLEHLEGLFEHRAGNVRIEARLLGNIEELDGRNHRPVGVQKSHETFVLLGLGAVVVDDGLEIGDDPFGADGVFELLRPEEVVLVFARDLHRLVVNEEVSAGFLRAFERHVGLIGESALFLGSNTVDEGDSRRHRDVDLVILKEERTFGERLVKIGGLAFDAFPRPCPVEKDGELVGGHLVDAVRRIHRERTEPLPHFHQHAVPEQVSVKIVDLLERIDVNEDEGGMFAVADVLEKLAPVGKPRQAVRVQLTDELVLLFHERGNIARGGDELNHLVVEAADGNNGGTGEVHAPVLASVFENTLPDVACAQRFHRFRGKTVAVRGMPHFGMGPPDDFFGGVAGNTAELVVDIGDGMIHVRLGDDGTHVDGVLVVGKKKPRLVELVRQKQRVAALVDRAHERLELDGLEQVLVDTDVDGFDKKVGIAVRGGNDDRNVGVDFLDFTRELEPADFGHPDIDNDDVGMNLPVEIETDAPVFGRPYRGDALPKILRQFVAHRHVVFHIKNGQSKLSFGHPNPSDRLTRTD